MRSKKAVYNISTNLVLQIVILIYGLIVPKIIITLFGSEVNGLTSSIVQFLNYITLLESGFGPVVKSVLYKPIANKDKKSITNILKASERFFHTVAAIFIFYIVFLIIFYPMIINSNFDKSFTVWKSSSYLNEEGYKAALGEDSYLGIPGGISQIKLVKVLHLIIL